MANEAEQREIDQLPEKYRPLGMWGYFGYTVLFSIPLIGFICTIVFSFNDASIARRNFARSYFCWLIIACVLFFLLSSCGALAYLAAGL